MCSRALAVVAAVATLWWAAAIPLVAQNSRWGANYFPNVTLTTQDGASVHFYDDLIKGKIVAINLIYTTCTSGGGWKSWQCPRRELKSYADAPPLTIDPGEYTFKQHCAACHTFGQGDHIGPDLLGVTKARDRAWLAGFILAPDRMLADGDP